MKITFDKDSTERSLRTIFHGVVGLIAAVPVIVYVVHTAGLDQSQQIASAMATMIAATGLASKVLNGLEERGWIPAFLKSSAPSNVPLSISPEPSDGTVPLAAVGPISEAEHDGPLADSLGNVASPIAPIPEIPTTPATPVSPAPVVSSETPPTT